MGIGTIMNAKQVLLLATGESKAEILKRSLFGKIQPEVPASVLQLHRHLTVVADEAALTLIRAEFPKSIS
jgi:glucosamine-6-phosphate deaminase